MDEAGQSNDFKSSWNNSQGITEQIDMCLRMANQYFMIGELGNAFNAMSSVVMRFSQHLSEDEEKKLEEIENKTGVAIRTYQILKDSQRANENIKDMARRRYKEYNNTIMKLLNSKGLLLQGKKDSTQMKW